MFSHLWFLPSSKDYYWKLLFSIFLSDDWRIWMNWQCWKELHRGDLKCLIRCLFYYKQIYFFIKSHVSVFSLSDHLLETIHHSKVRKQDLVGCLSSLLSQWYACFLHWVQCSDSCMTLHELSFFKAMFLYITLHSVFKGIFHYTQTVNNSVVLWSLH